MLDIEKSGLLVVDVQGNLARIVHESEAVIKNIGILIQGCQILQLPVILLEQNPPGLGQTVPEVRELLKDYTPLAKQTFNACATPAIEEVITKSGVEQWIVCGIEAHVCLYQTSLGLLSKGYEVEIAADSISSRSKTNIDIALKKLQGRGASLTSVEMCLLELTKDARKEEFRQILALIK
jgi:isochorismate hydrolase